MMNFPQLVALAHSLRDAHVLTVYLNGTATDPAQQRSWRVQLDQRLANLRRLLSGSDHAEREAFEQGVRLLEIELAAFTENVRMPGWAAFITADRVHVAALLPVAMPNLAVWSTGPSVAPYMRALKEIREVVVVHVDSTRADIYKYRLGRIEHVSTMRAHHTVMTPSHMGDAPRPGFHGGTRGATGHDQAQRSLLAGTKRMLWEAVEASLRLASPDAWIVTGGIPQVGRHLADMLAARAPNRVLHDDSLDIHASKSDLATAAREAASRLRNAMDKARIAQIVDVSSATGLGAIGPAATRETLDQRRVRDLYLTLRYLEEHPADAEDAARAAMDQGALIEEVSGPAAELLDAHGGIAARLRYCLAQPQAS